MTHRRSGERLFDEPSRLKGNPPETVRRPSRTSDRGSVRRVPGCRAGVIQLDANGNVTSRQGLGSTAALHLGGVGEWLATLLVRAAGVGLMPSPPQ